MAVALDRSVTRWWIAHSSDRRRHPRLSGAVLAGSVGWLWVVARDGSVPWQLARASAVVLVTTAVWIGFDRWRQRQVGDVAAALGMVGVVTGVGLLPYVAKTGLSAESGAALAVLAPSVLLLVGGVAISGRGRRRWARAASAVATTLVTALSVWIISPAIAATNVPDTAIGRTLDAAGLDADDVVLRTTDGIDLAGWWVPSTNRAAVVLLHGSGSTRSNVVDHAAALARHGFGVLLLDARGHGESGGRAMDFGWYGDLDIDAATRFVASTATVDRGRIALLGLSMGGEEAIGATASNDLIRAVVAEGVTARSAGDEAWLSDRYGWRGGLQERFEWAQDVVTDLLTSASPPVSNRDAVRAAAGTDYLLIAAGTVPEERHAAAHVASVAPERVSTWTVDGAGHTDALRTAPQEWESRVVSFLGRALGLDGQRTEET